MTKTHYYVSEYSNAGEGKIAVKVKFNDGRLYILHFYEPKTVKKELDGCKQKPKFFAVPGVVVLDSVSMESINKALAGVYATGFFDKLMPEKTGE